MSLALLSDMIAPGSPLATGLGPSLAPPSSKFRMGTDQLGRDWFSGIVHGSRIALLVSVVAAVTATTIGLIMGVVSGYFGGLTDDLLMRATEIMMVLPTFILALVVVTLYGNSIWNMVFVIGVLSWPTIARIARAEVLSFREREFVEAARMLGSNSIDVMFKEILPNILPPVIVAGSLQMSTSIIIEAGLSFLGLGDPTVLSWGRMLYIAQQAFQAGAWWLVVFPGTMITVAALAFNLVGDGLNDALNPRLR